MKIQKLNVKSFLLFMLSIIIGANLNAQSESTLYQVSGEGIQDFYLFGTVHIMPQEEFELKDKVTTALEQSDKVVFELDLDDPSLQQVMMSNSMLPDQKTIESYLTTEEYELLGNAIQEELGIDIAMVKSLKPFFLSTMLLKKFVGENPASFEGSLMELAMAGEKEILGLEKVEDQLKIFDAIPYQEQADDLIEMLVEEEKMEKLFQEMIDDYKNEEVTKLYDLFVNYFDNDKDLIDLMLNDRNHNWIPTLKQLAAEDKIFVGVGAGHLGGAEGLIKLLQEEGYIVTAL